MKKSTPESVRLVFKLQSPEPERLPDAELKFSIAEEGTNGDVDMLVSALTVLGQDTDDDCEEFSFDNSNIIATYAGGKFYDLEVLRCPPSPRDPGLADLWSFVKQRDDTLLAAALHTTMSIWQQIETGLRTAEFTRQNADLQQMIRELFGDAPRTTWVSCNGTDHSTESVWAGAVK